MKVGSLCSEAFVSEPFLQRKNILGSVHGRGGERREKGAGDGKLQKRERGKDRAS